jgi:hypothetical protein
MTIAKTPDSDKAARSSVRKMDKKVIGCNGFRLFFYK